MAITVIDNVSESIAESTSTYSLSLPVSLENDVWIIVLSRDDNQIDDTSAQGEGWTREYLSASSLRFGIISKRMGATPDTSVTIDRVTTAANSGINCIGQLFRGCDETTYLDQTTPAASTGSTTSPNCPAITTQTDGAMVVAIAAMDDETTTVSTWPTGYTDQLERAGGGAPHLTTNAMSSKIVSPAGVEDPSTYVFAATDLWDAVTIALKPSAGGSSIIPQIMHHRRQMS